MRLYCTAIFISDFSFKIIFGVPRVLWVALYTS